MYCKKCGKVIPDDSKYCPYCGEDLFDIPPITTKEFDETKNHIDAHRHGAPISNMSAGSTQGACIPNVSTIKQAQNKPLPMVKKAIVLTALTLAIISLILSIAMIIIPVAIQSTSKAFGLKKALLIIAGILYILSAGFNFSIIFIDVGIKSVFVKTQWKFDIGLRIVYLLIALAGGIIMLVCAYACFNNPSATDNVEFYLVAPSAFAMATLIFSGAMVGCNSMITAKDRAAKILASIKK